MHHDEVQCEQTSYFVFGRRLLRKQQRNVLFARDQNGSCHLSTKGRATRPTHDTPSNIDIVETHRA